MSLLLANYASDNAKKCKYEFCDDTLHDTELMLPLSPSRHVPCQQALPLKSHFSNKRNSPTATESQAFCVFNLTVLTPLLSFQKACTSRPLLRPRPFCPRKTPLFCGLVPIPSLSLRRLSQSVRFSAGHSATGSLLLLPLSSSF